MATGIPPTGQTAQRAESIPMSNPNTPATPDLKVTYGNTTLDFAVYPASSLVAMLRRGVTHLLGSEQASKLQGKIERLLAGDSKESKAAFEALSDVERRAAIRGWREANPTLLAEMAQGLQEEALASLAAGTVGTSTRGPSVDPLSAVQNRLAKAEVVNVLKAHKIAVPKKSDDVVEFPNGDKFTMAVLVARRLAHPDHGARVVKEAKAVIAAQERANKKAEASGLGDL